MADPANSKSVEMVNLTIDGKPVRVPKGINLIEAARLSGVEIPFYCYHPHLSIAGNCRMCQVRVVGRPKMEIGCNTLVAEGMVVETQETSKDVQDSQAATLEFILINHPLDCTVCDQAGHCKLQDFHYDYNARPSRFLEEKVHKVKAEPLGPTVMLDGERCIMCTRCIRFCDEITGTSELGMLNRGDRSVISINPGKELNNPLSGTVVDLCPVGALTHKNWRFNTRIWFTEQTDSICPGCSTGCNVKVAERNGEVVQVKARLNSEVNKEWLCDEGRYGFERFLPPDRLVSAKVGGQEAGIDAALREAAKIKGNELLVFVAGDILLEEYAILKRYLDTYAKNSKVAISYRERKLTPVEAILISPDYCANFRGAEFSGLVSGSLESGYADALQQLRSGSAKNVLILGDSGILGEDRDAAAISGLTKAHSVGLVCDASSALTAALKVALPARSILEKQGLLINRKNRLQWNDRVVQAPDGTQADWQWLNQIAQNSGKALIDSPDDRAKALWYLGAEPRLQGLRIQNIKAGGVCLNSYRPGSQVASEGAGAPAV